MNVYFMFLNIILYRKDRFTIFYIYRKERVYDNRYLQNH